MQFAQFILLAVFYSYPEEGASERSVKLSYSKRYYCSSFDVLLIVHLCIILVINQLNAQILVL